MMRHGGVAMATSQVYSFVQGTSGTGGDSGVMFICLQRSNRFIKAARINTFIY